MSNETGSAFTAQVHQAQGMVSVQARCSLTEALIRMIEMAETANVTIDDVAEHALDRTVRFD